jgi:hypothetical protein
MANRWFVMIPPDFIHSTDDERRQVDFRVQYPYPSKAWTDANAGRVVQGAEGNTGNPQISAPLIKWKGPFATEAQAKKAQAPTASPTPRQALTHEVKNAAADALGLNGLFQANLWLRVAEVVVGLVLIAVGVAHITNAVPIATKVATKVGMAAAL